MPIYSRILQPVAAASLALMIGVISCPAIFAVTASDKTPSMKEAVDAALRQHPRTTLVSTQQAVGDAYQSQANALFAGDPSYSLSYQSDQLDRDQGFREFEGSLDFPLWMSGQKNSRQALAESLVSKASAEQQLLAWEVSGVVLERAWELRMAEMDVEQTKIQQASAKALEQNVARRVQAGEIARSDLLLAQQNTAEAELTYQEAIAQVGLARTGWQTYTGFTRLPADLIEQQPKQTQPIALNHQQHPHAIASEARMNTAAAQRENTRKLRSDNLVLSFYAKRDRGSEADPFNNSLGVGVSVPFGSNKSALLRNAEAKAQMADITATEAEREREHELETRQAELKVKHEVKKLSLVKQQNALAQDHWKLSNRAFELGESDLFHLIRARQQADIQARALQRSQLELSLSQARLNHILGALPR